MSSSRESALFRLFTCWTLLTHLILNHTYRGARTLAPFGKFISVGVLDNRLPLDGSQFLMNGCYFGGSHLGSKTDVERMLNLAVEKSIKPWCVLFRDILTSKALILYYCVQD